MPVCVIRECRAYTYAPDTLDKVASGSEAPHHHSIKRRKKNKMRRGKRRKKRMETRRAERPPQSPYRDLI